MGEENNEKKTPLASRRGTQQRTRRSPWESELSTLEQYFSYWIHWEIQRNKTPGIEHDIFDNTGVHDAANFHRSLKHIADHFQLTCGNEVCEAIRTTTPVIITIPPVPTGTKDPNDSSGQTILPVDDITIYLWKEKHKNASAKLDKYEVDMARAHIIIFHQCTPSLKNELKRQITSRQFAWLNTRLPSSN